MFFKHLRIQNEGRAGELQNKPCWRKCAKEPRRSDP